jgi:hypothetical protein
MPSTPQTFPGFSPEERRSPMLSFLSRAYVYTFIPLLLLLITTLLTFHIAILAGSHFEPNGRFYSLFFAINLPLLGLAEDRNIWANEVKQCPIWLRTTFCSLFVYCFAVMLACIFIGNMHLPTNFFLAASAFMLMFSFGSACVLWVTVRSARLNPSDLLQRTRRSLVGVALFSAFYLVFAMFPPKTLHH